MAIKRSASAEAAFTPSQTFAVVQPEKELLGYVVRNDKGRYLQSSWSDATWGEWSSAERFDLHELETAEKYVETVGGRVIRVTRRKL